MMDNLRVLFIGAMETEIAELRTHFACAPSSPIHRAYPFWSARSAGLEIGVLQTHVGDINAATATPEALRRFDPDCVFKIGCVGGHADGIHTGDIVVPMAFFHSGAWITRAHSNNTPTADATQWQSLFGEQPYQVNSINLGGRAHVLPPDLALTDHVIEHLHEQGLAHEQAYVGSSSIWFFDPAFMSHVLTAQVSRAVTKAWVADMESYAIAQACAVYNKPFTGLYRVSNSDYYGEAYHPEAVANLFAGGFISTLDALLRRIALHR